MGLELRAVQTDEEWAAMHDIRRRVLFAPGRHSPDIIYDENHPEDRADGNVPHLLMLEEIRSGLFASICATPSPSSGWWPLSRRIRGRATAA